MPSLVLSYSVRNQAQSGPAHSQSMIWSPRRCECLSLAMTFAENNIGQGTAEFCHDMDSRSEHVQSQYILMSFM